MLQICSTKVTIKQSWATNPDAMNSQATTECKKMGIKYSRKSTNQFAEYGSTTGRDSLRGDKISSEYGIRVIAKKANVAMQEYTEMYKVICERRRKVNANKICIVSSVRSHQNISNSIVCRSRRMIS